METAIWIIIAVGAAFVGYIAASIVAKKNAKSSAKVIIDEAKMEAGVIKEKQLLKAKEEEIKIISEAEKTANQKLQKIQASENRARQKELQLNQQQSDLAKRKNELDARQNNIEKLEVSVNSKNEEAETLIKNIREELEKVSGLSAEEAKERLIE